MGLVIQPLTRLEKLIKELNIEIGVITTPPLEAQRMADLFFDAGVKAVLNFSSDHLRKPDCCLVQNVDFTMNLDNLAYELSKKD